jgi:hypothetical protein
MVLMHMLIGFGIHLYLAVNSYLIKLDQHKALHIVIVFPLLSTICAHACCYLYCIYTTRLLLRRSL